MTVVLDPITGRVAMNPIIMESLVESEAGRETKRRDLLKEEVAVEKKEKAHELHVSVRTNLRTCGNVKAGEDELEDEGEDKTDYVLCCGGPDVSNDDKKILKFQIEPDGFPNLMSERIGSSPDLKFAHDDRTKDGCEFKPISPGIKEATEEVNTVIRGRSRLWFIYQGSRCVWQTRRKDEDVKDDGGESIPNNGFIMVG